MADDKIIILNKRLKKVVEAFNTLQKSGLNKEFMIIYISHKAKLPIRDVKKMIESMEEFYQKLCDDDLLEAI